MTGPRLFEPFRLGAMKLANRIVIAPMCQYSAVDGGMTDWHMIHLGHLALSCAALLTIEATAVLPEGRITHGDVGLWDDPTEAARLKAQQASISRYEQQLRAAHGGKLSTYDEHLVHARQDAANAAILKKKDNAVRGKDHLKL